MKDIWRMQHPQKREYSRFPYLVNPDPEMTVTPKRLDYIMVNANMKQHVADSRIINNSTLDWKSDHGIIEIEIVGMPIIKETSEDIFQRPMWQTRKMTEEIKIGMQSEMDRIITQDEANSNTEWMEMGVKNWMKDNLTKTKSKRSLSLYVTKIEYKERKEMVRVINMALGSEEEKKREKVEKIGKQIIEAYKIMEMEKEEEKEK